MTPTLQSRKIEHWLPAYAAFWEEKGRASEQLLTGWWYMTAAVWFMHHGSRMSALVHEFMQASERQAGGQEAYNEFWGARDNCELCWEPCRRDNGNVCTDHNCLTFWCWRCSAKFGDRHRYETTPYDDS